MYFVDNNTGTTEMPALAPSQGTQVKWFTEGDGNKGISHIGQDWLNIIQAELLAILTEGKIKPDKTKLNQLTLAIKAIITANAFSRKNNLKEIQDAGVQAQTNARKALGLGALATKDKLSSTDVGALEKSKNLSDVPDKATARKNIEVYSKTEGDGRYLRKDQNLKDISNAGTARTNLGVYSKSEGDGRYLRKDQNLKDVGDAATSRTNLDVYSKSEVYTKTEGDGRYLRKDQNLKDISNAGTARTNLSVYSKSEGDGRYLRKEQNLKDVGDAATARTNLSVYSKSDVYTRTEGDSRYLRKDQNGKDIANKSTFIDNLGLRETVNKAANALPASGTAVAANKLSAARKINGVAFDGTRDINITSGMTQATADGRYVRNVQLGAQSRYSPAGNEVSWDYKTPSGCMLSGIVVQDTGRSSADNIGGVYYRPVQIYISNAWRTVGSV